MQAAIEISMYPLNQEYEPPILDFIDRLNTYPEIRIITNSMSTQLSGDYDQLMTALQREMKTSFERGETVVMVMKVIKLG
ncbi:MAG: hypothetical protein DHS20C18_36740 [Saprospiraceae bacterium]|nr:MAG: hypothetical protein DHS20C18_36740 [Saprospiraceae bacterium]